MSLDTMELLSAEEIDERIEELDEDIKIVKEDIAFNEVSKSALVYLPNKKFTDETLQSLNNSLNILQTYYKAYQTALDAVPEDYI